MRRAKAEEYLKSAAQTVHPAIRRKYLDLARQWRELAADAVKDGRQAPHVSLDGRRRESSRHERK